MRELHNWNFWDKFVNVKIDEASDVLSQEMHISSQIESGHSLPYNAGHFCAYI
jgi:hypothetical protein